jgi:TniQ
MIETASTPLTLVIRTKPKPDESYLGFLLRLSELNEYDNPRWILSEANLSRNTFKLKSSVLDGNLGGLSRLSGVSLDCLRNLVPYSASDNSNGTTLKKPARGHVLRSDRPRLCPPCLDQSNHYRKQWDLPAVTSCPIHHLMLIELCPGCQKPITWFRKSVSRCRCGFDWRQARANSLSKDETVVSRLIYEGLSLLPPKRGNRRRRNPLFDSNLSSLLGALFLVTSQQAGYGDTTGKLIFRRKSNAEIHANLLKAVSVFELWPTNFYKFLERLQSLNKSRKDGGGLQNSFGSFYFHLYRHKSLSSNVGEVLRTEFERYLLDHWNDGYVTKAKWFKDGSFGGKYTSRTSAASSLGIDRRVLDRMASQGKIRAVVKKSGSKRLFLVEVASLEKLRVEFSRYLSLASASKLTGLSQINVLRLVENSTLTAHRDPTANDLAICRLKKAVVENFISKVLSTTVKAKVRRQSDLRTFNSLLKALMLEPAETCHGIQTLVSHILAGQLIPRGLAKDSAGLSALLFSRKEVRKYLAKFRKSTGVRLQIEGKVKDLGMDRRLAYFLASKGLVKTEYRSLNGNQHRMITRRTVDLFKSKFTFAVDVARELDLPTDKLLETLRTLNVFPVSGKSVDDGPRYLLKRSDVEQLNLRLLTPRHQIVGNECVPKLSFTINSYEVAKILSVAEPLVNELVDNDVLRPYPESQNSKSGYLFNRTIVEKMKGQFNNLVKLVSIRAAAKILHVGVGTVNDRWLRAGYLQPVISNDGKKQLFLKSDVERIAAFKADVVTGVEAARLIHVNWSNIQEWTKTGLLKTLVNPYPLAITRQCYSRAELANLTVIDLKIRHYWKKVIIFKQ